MITINELFSGIGAQVAALKRLGIEYETVGIAEIDRFAIQSYEAINGKTRNYGDISKVEKLDYADLWTYSSPCQDFSIAGYQKGLTDENGEQTRSGLLLEVERLLRKAVADGKAPKYLLLENVKNLVGKKFRPDFDRWLNTLEELGYNNYWKVLNAKDYGVPQNRERVFAVSIRKDIDDGEFKFPEKAPLEHRLKDVLEANVDEKFYLKKELCDRFIEKFQKRDVSNTIRCGGSGSIDQKHTWDLVAEPSIVQNPHGFNKGGIVKGNVAPTMTSNGSYHLNNFVCEGPLIAASRGRNPDNPSSREAGLPTVQMLEINESGCSNTLTTVGKDNLVVEPNVLTPKRTEYGKAIRKEYEAGYIQESRHNMTEMKPRTDGISNTLTTVQKDNYLCEPISAHIDDTAPASTATDYKPPKCCSGVIQLGNIVETDSFGGNPERGHVYDDKGISPCLSTMQGGGLEPKILKGYRIRKLTPKECWRLMDFTDEEFEAAQNAGGSKTQLYKQAGNSIVVAVLAAIFKNLFQV